MKNGEQQTNIENLIDALLEIKSTSHLTQKLKDKLKADVKKLVEDANPPGVEEVTTLITDFKQMILDGVIDRELLSTDLDAVIASMNINSDDAKAVKEDLRKILFAVDISQDEKEAVIAALEAIVVTAHDNHPHRAAMQ